MFFTSYNQMSGIQKISKLIKKGNTQKLGQLLQDPSLDINQLDPKSGKSLLQLSIQCDQKQAFQIILKTKGIKLDTVSKSGQTALQTAILMNSVQCIQQILRSKGNIKIKRQPGHSAMETAIKNKTSPQIISKLLYHGFDVNQSVTTYGSLLNLSIACNQFQNFTILLNNPNIDIRIADQQQNTSLLLAVKQKKGEYARQILKKLQNNQSKTGMKQIQKQFYVNATDKNGDTVLHIAAKKDYQTILDILLKQGIPLGIDVSIKNKQGKTYQDIQTQRIKQRQKQKANQLYQQRKRIQQKRIKNKEKQQQKIRLAIEEQQQRAAQKKRKKQQQLLQAQRLQMKIKMQKNRKIWIAGISILVIVGVMYLLFLSAAKPKQAYAF